MSGRYHDYSKGSSRSTRDDSRHKDGRKRRQTSRSRSPKRSDSAHGSGKYSPESSRRNRDYQEEQRRHKVSSGSDEEVPAPPSPPRITKISIGFTKPAAPIKMNIGGPAKPTASKSKAKVASVFNDDEDDEPEEMPAEAKMRMRNIGRETPTSAGPNSFGKTKQGFCDSKKVFEKNLKQALESEEKPPMAKFPQTIYRIKGP